MLTETDTGVSVKLFRGVKQVLKFPLCLRYRPQFLGVTQQTPPDPTLVVVTNTHIHEPLLHF
jgi:hypothetical protein